MRSGQEDQALTPRQFHLLITPTFFQKCQEYGLFGVSERNMNQLANVRKGDIAFFYTTERRGDRTVGLIYGPYEVISPLFYNDTLVWTPSIEPIPKVDKYPYRIKFQPLQEHTCRDPVPIQALWDIKQEEKIRSIIDSSALTNKAVCTLLPQEGILLLQTLLQANQIPIKDTSKKPGHAFKEEKIDLLKFKGKTSAEFPMESYMETYLLLNEEKLHQMSGFKEWNRSIYRAQIFNQVSTFIAGGAIDIVVLYEKKVLDIWITLNATVFELKKGPLIPENVDHLVEYIEWGARLLPGAKKEMIKGRLVGRELGNSLDRKQDLINRLSQVQKFYSVEAFQYRPSSRQDDVIFEQIA